MELQMRSTKMKLPKGIRKSEQRLTRMMLFIFGVFFVTYMPGVVVKMVSITALTQPLTTLILTADQARIYYETCTEIG